MYVTEIERPPRLIQRMVVNVSSLVLGGFPDVGRLLFFHPKVFGWRYSFVLHHVMRGRSCWSWSERELMATLVSDRNDCAHCIASHTPVASSKLGSATVAASVMAPACAPLREDLRLTLVALQTLTVRPLALGHHQIEDIRRAGGGDCAIEDAIAVCILFDLTNRIADGVGCQSIAPLYSSLAKRVYGRVVLLTGYAVWGVLAHPRFVRIDSERPFDELFADLRLDALQSSGALAPELRCAAERQAWSRTLKLPTNDGDLLGAASPLVDKIAAAAPSVNRDDHTMLARNGFGPRATCEFIVAAAFGAARARLELALAAAAPTTSLTSRWRPEGVGGPVHGSGGNEQTINRG